MKKLLVGLLIGSSIFALAGCGSSKSAASDYEYYEEALAAETYDTGDFGFEEEASVDMKATSTESNGGNAETVGETSTSRKLITTVSIRAQVTDVDECAVKIKDRVNQYGGYVEYELCEDDYGDYTIRIPSKNLDEFLQKIEEYSNVTYHTSSVEDVTLSYVDIEARISTLKVEQQRLEEFMAAAESVEDIITIEDRLTDVRYELQSYESQKRTYDNKIDYCTVHLNISEVSTYTAPEKGTIGERIRAGLAENIYDLGENMGNILVWFGTVIPILLIIAIPIGIIFLAIFLPVNAAMKKKEAKRRAEQEAQKAKEAE